MSAGKSEVSTIVVCQGPPTCDLVGDAAIASIRGGCVWCKRIIIDEDGSERVEEPGHA